MVGQIHGALLSCLLYPILHTQKTEFTHLNLRKAHAMRFQIPVISGVAWTGRTTCLPLRREPPLQQSTGPLRTVPLRIYTA